MTTLEEFKQNHTIEYIHKDKTTNLLENQGVPYIAFPKLSEYGDDIVHGFSTRLGGVSKEHLFSMNLSFSRGDDEANVMENHRLFAKALGYPYEKLVFSNQVHTTFIHKVTKEDAGKGITKESDILEIDGLVTNEPDIPLITFYADCVPLFFFDPVKKVIGMAHSGWKGTVGRIGEKMLQFMQKEYGSKPEDVICAIAPSICQKCYEVSEDVADAFIEVFGTSHGDELLYQKDNGKYQLNLHKACEITLLEAGVTKDHLDITDLCTCCNPELLYSHRKSNGMRGNLGGIMMLKNN